MIQAVTFLGWWVHLTLSRGENVTSNDRGWSLGTAWITWLGYFCLRERNAQDFFLWNQNIFGTNDVFMVCFFLGGRNACEVCFELFVPRNTFGRLARYLFGTPSFIFGLFFWKTSLFWRLFKKSKFLGFDTSTYIRNIYRCMGRKHPSDSRDLWLGVSRIFCFEIQIHGFFPSLCRFHLARKRYWVETYGFKGLDFFFVFFFLFLQW